MAALSREGAWGPVTATLDWCEENYQFSYYIAEYANSFSNLLTVWLAANGAVYVVNQGIETRYMLSFAALGLVGIGSFAFHSTLTYEAQMADELPMIYTASWSLFVMLVTEPMSEDKLRERVLFVGMMLFNGIFTWSYYLYRNPVYHQVVFASLLLISLARTVYLTRISPVSNKIPQDKMNEASRLYLIGAGLFALGFLIWNIDNIFCGYLTDFKQSIGWPAGFFFEGHSWWHALTGAGTYAMLQGNMSRCVSGTITKPIPCITMPAYQLFIAQAQKQRNSDGVDLVIGHTH